MPKGVDSRRINQNKTMKYNSIQDVIKALSRAGKLSSSHTSQLLSLCNMGGAAIAASNIKALYRLVVDDNHENGGWYEINA